MRKTSQDGGDSTSITSGAENEFKKSGILKSKRNSVKRKVQSHDHDDGIIEPLLQKENEKTKTGNESAKHLSSKLKTDSTSKKRNDMEKLLTDDNVEKPIISDIPRITAMSHLDNVTEIATRKVNSIAPTRNHMHSYVFSSNTGTKELPKSQILVEIDANKQSIYNPSPLIFTTAKIHTDGNAKNMDLVNVTPVPIISTTEGKITKSGCDQEPNGSITHKIDNNLSKTYAKTGVNSLVNIGSSVGESSANKNHSSQSELPSYTKTSLADSVSKPEKSGKSLSNTARSEENIVDINKNIETVDINSTNLKSDVSVTTEKILRNPSEVTKLESSQNVILNTCVSSGTLNTGFPSFVTFTCSSNVSITPKTIVSSTTAGSTSVTETKNTALTSKTKSPISSIKIRAPTCLSSSTTFAQTPTSTTIKSNFAAKDLITTKTPLVSTDKSVSMLKSIPSSNAVSTSSTKDSKPFTKPISSTSAVPSQVKNNKPTTVLNTTTAVNQISKLSSSTNTKVSVGQQPNSTSMKSVSVNSPIAMASSIAKSASVPKTKSVSTSIGSTILSNKTPKAIVSKSPSSSEPTTTAATSTGIKKVPKAKATTPNVSINKTNSTPNTGKESTMGSKPVTNKIPATTNTAPPTRSTLSSTIPATNVGTVNNKASVANELNNIKNNDRNDGKGKA